MAPEFRALVATHAGHHNKSPKDHLEWAAINASAPWLDQQLSPLELAEWIQSGKAWTACHLGGRSHSEDHVVASNLIVLDIDGDLTLETFWAIPAVQRHCLFTATSCSHTQQEHRFRALFAVDSHEEVDLHGAIYDLWIERLGIQLKDNCGRKPERLWYGNDQAVLQFGGGELIPWDLVEQARDNLKAARAALPRASTPVNPDELDLDLRRAVFAFDQLLRVSVDGDFSGGYWKELLLAAAATGDEAVQQAFLQWHHRGHHSKTQSQVKRRLQRSRSRMSPGEGAGKILKLAKEQHGQLWWRLLPQELWYGQGGGGLTPPTVLGRSRSLSDIAPIGTVRTPDVVPSPAQLEKLADQARVTVLASSSPSDHGVPNAAAPSEPATLNQKLRRLYQLRAHGILETGDDLQEVAESERATLDRELLGDVLAHPGYCNQPSEVERDLLALFRAEQGLRDNSHREVQGIKLTGPNLVRPTWLIPNFLLVGGEHIFYSKPGVGKTTLALHLARAVTGDPALERFLDSGPINNHHLWQRNTIIFIGTDMFASAREMTTKYLEDFGLLGLDFLQQIEWWFESEETPAWQLNLKDLTKLYRTLEHHHHVGAPVPAVFIDSMKAVCPDHLLVGQQGFKDYIKLVKMICRRFNTALVWVHHSRADGTGAQGITRITEGSDANFHLKRDEKTRQITLDVEKIRGGKGRTLYINPFKTIPLLLPNPELLHGEDDIDDLREQLILEVLADDFRRHRLLNATSSAEWIEGSYEGMKIGQIENALKERFRSRSAGLSRPSLERLIRSLKDSGRIAVAPKARYRLPPHFQLDLPNQDDLLDSIEPDQDDPDVNLPGW